MTRMALIGIMLMVLCLQSCLYENDSTPLSVNGWAPVYLLDTNPDTVTYRSPIPTSKPGKIVLYNGFIFQVDINTGVHVIKFINGQTTEKFAFYEIYGCNQISIKEDYLYANTLDHLLVIDIQNLVNPKVVSFYPHFYETFPFLMPPTSGFFECIDPNKGIVIDWVSKELNAPKCLL